MDKYPVGTEVVVNWHREYVFGFVTKVIKSNNKRKVQLFSGATITCDIFEIVDTLM